MRLELCNCEATILGEITTPEMDEGQVALTYRLCLQSSERDSIDWGRVNRAILARWGLAALERIKRRAWGEG